MDAAELQNEIFNLEKKYNGQFAVQAESVSGQMKFSHNADIQLPVASVMKIFILCELFHQVGQGKISLSEQLTWRKEHEQDGNGVLKMMRGKQKLSLFNFAVLMMIQSDNIATMLLEDILGVPNIQKFINGTGLKKTDVYKGMYGGRERDMTRRPVSTARELVTLMLKIYRHEILSPEYCEEIIRIMRNNQLNDMVPRYLPISGKKGSENWIANKNGYGSCRCEAAIVKFGKNVYSLGMFFKPGKIISPESKCLADYSPVIAMGEASKTVFDHMTTLKEVPA
jgi:beta-lactamase class A